MPDDDRSARAGPTAGHGSGRPQDDPVDPDAATRIADEPASASVPTESGPVATRVLDEDAVDAEAPTVVGESFPAGGTGGADEPGEVDETGETGSPEPADRAAEVEGADAFAEAETVLRPRASAGDGDAPAGEGAAGAASEASAPAAPEPGRAAPQRVAPPPPAPSPPPSGVAPGSILFGEYEVIEVLGAGGMGEVYRARHRRLGEYRAIKMMHAELATKQGANEFFLREAKALLAVRHPAVVHCHDLLSDAEGRIYLVMEMIDGISLADRLLDGPLPADQVVVLGARLAAGLQAAHACGVVHRDVSPDNIVLPGGEVESAKLIDFGIAKILEEGQGTIIDGFKGKLSYASPEQLGFFGGQIDGRSDFYSLGLVLCAAALGRPMGMGTTVVEAVDARRAFQHVPDAIPVGLRSAIEPLLALDPQKRPMNVERLFLAPGGDQPGLAAIRASSAPARAEPGRVGAWRLVAAGVAVALGIGSYVVLSGRGGETGAVAEPAAAQAAAAQPAAEPARVAAMVPEPAAAEAATADEAPAPALRASALDEVRIVGLLRGAEAAIAENRLQSPEGDNAYEKYRAVLEIDPDNQAARRGLVAVAGRYLALSRSALAQSDSERARSYLARAASIAPHHPDLDAVRAEVDAAGSP